LKRWQKISSKVLFKNRYWTYCLDGSTMIIPKMNDKFILVEQYRYLNDMFSIEFPCGSIEEGLDEISNARKELEEETGFTSDNLIKIGFFSPYNGVADELCSVFFTDNLKKVDSTPDETEEFVIHFLSEEEIDNLIKENKIWDGMTISAWTLFKFWKSK